MYNLLGWKTNRKLVIFTSDDWGSIRLISAAQRASLIADGFNMSASRFNKFDALETDDDLNALFNVLRKFKDIKGNYPVITAMTNPANPDFEKIRAFNFETYYYLPLDQIVKNLPGRTNVLDLYREGIDDRIFIPQYHGREHLNVRRWMTALQQNYAPARKAFDHEFFQPDKSDLSGQFGKGFGAAYDPDDLSDIALHNDIIADGLQQFSRLFKYDATCFTAPSLISNSGIEKSLSDCGIKLVDRNKIEKMPTGNGKHITRLNYIGKKTSSGLSVITRTAVFEPNISTSSNNVDECMRNIADAFRNKKPAIISNHRAAFSGEIDVRNRSEGLAALEQLLTQILQKWPDAEFVDLASLHQIITENA